MARAATAARTIFPVNFRGRSDIGTAGATGLVPHTVYLPLTLTGRPSELTLTGGTHVTTSPCYHFLDATWRQYLEACGLRMRLRMVRPGFYPRGGGEVQAVIQGSKLHGLTLGDRGKVSVSAVSAIAGLPDHVAHRQARRLTYRLEKAGHKVAVREETWEARPGSVVLVTLDTKPAPTVFWAPGARGKPAEAVADEAADETLAYLNAGPGLVDPHSADQIVLALALAEGPSEYRVGTVTEHLTTNIAVIRRFLDRDIVCDGDVGGPGTVRISG